MILERVAGEGRSRVRPLWSGFPVVILGCGPSLTQDQIDHVREARAADAVRVIAVNDSYLVADFADIVYFADAKWIGWHSHGVAKPKLGLSGSDVRSLWDGFAGQKCGIETAEPYLPVHVHVLRVAPWTPERGLSTDPGAIATGRHDGYMGHSGFQALNLATLSGSKNIILLAYDGRPGTDGRTHFHGSHPSPTPEDVWNHIRRSFSCVENELKAAGVRVVNCSPNSSIDSFEKVSLSEALMVSV